jgi:hypothetical protein
MTPSDYNQRLIDRQTALRTRVQQAFDNVTLSEQRLTQARQRLAIAQGELKAVTEVVNEQASEQPTKDTPAA